MSRLELLPPYLFSALDAAKRQAIAEGAVIVDLGIGDPDRPTPPELVQVMAAAVADPRHHRYPAQAGAADLRSAIALWMERRHGVRVDPSSQVLVLQGSKEGLAHLPLACLQEGDDVLVPDIGYPVYGQATLLAGGVPRAFPLAVDRGFLPDLRTVAEMAGARTRLVFLNYPNNPTGAAADREFWRQAVRVCREADVILVNDAAYLEVTLDGRPGPSLLAAADPARDKVVEFHSLSKMFNMTGWRVGFAVGHPQVIAALRRVKESMDSGVFGAIQATAAFALGEDFDRLLARVMAVYATRRSAMVAALQAAGREVFPGAATFYLWARVPGGESSVDFCSRALREIGVVMAPGTGFGSGGEGWFRVSLTAGDDDIAEAARRLGKWR